MLSYEADCDGLALAPLICRKTFRIYKNRVGSTVIVHINTGMKMLQALTETNGKPFETMAALTL